MKLYALFFTMFPFVMHACQYREFFASRRVTIPTDYTHLLNPQPAAPQPQHHNAPAPQQAVAHNSAPAQKTNQSAKRS